MSLAGEPGPLVGRERELRALDAGLASAIAGRARLFLLTGEPGIGKTRLAHEASQQAAARSALAAWGRCWEAGGAPAYWPWLQVLRALVAATGAEALASAPGQLLASLLPGLRDGVPVAEPPPPEAGGDDAARFRLFDALNRFLVRSAARRPLVVVLDDLHAADASSLLLLRFVARSLRDARMLVIGTLREVEAQREPTRARLLAELARDADVLPLAALAAEDIATLVERETGQRSGELARRIHRVSEGNPLLAHEAIRMLRGRDGSADRVVMAGMPLLQDRLAPLSQACLRLLGVAATFGREFDTTDLRHAGALEPDEVLRLLGEAEAMGLVRQMAGDPPVYAFSHGLLRETLYAQLDPAARANVHRRVGEALERRHADDPGPRLAELARHFAEAAAGGGDVEKAVEYACHAGERARAVFAFADAAEHYDRALRLLEMAPHDGERGREVRLASGLAYMRAGDSGRARQTLLAVAEAARRAGDVERFARAAIGLGGRADVPTRTDRDLIAHLEEALELLGPEPTALRVRVLTRLAKCLYYAAPRAQVDGVAVRALEEARRFADPALLGAALDARHFSLWGPGPTAPKLAVANELVAAARAARSRELELAGHFWRFADLLEAGDLLGATTALGHYEEIAAELHEPFFAWRAATHRAALALMQGRLDDAERLVTHATALGARFASRNPSLIAGIQLYVLQRDRQPLPEMVPALRAMADDHPALPSFRAGLAHLLSELGRRDEARAEFEALAVAGFAQMPRDGNWFSMMGELAEVATYLGDHRRAAELYDLLLPYADQVVVTGWADVCEGAVARRLGILATTLRRWDDAATHLGRARDVNAPLGARPELGRTALALAAMLAARGAPGDHERALAALDEAADLAASVGMAALSAQVEALRNVLRTAPEADGVTLRRDGAVWTIAYDGRLARVKDSKGMRYLAELLASPGVERHAFELYAAVAGHRAASGADAAAADGLSIGGMGDIGPLLDDRAKREYRRRLDDLRQELADAEANCDLGRAERTRTETAALEQALGQAYGLGGRSRAAANAAERARVSVTKAVRQAIERIAEVEPMLGQHLRQTVRTGRFLAAAARCEPSERGGPVSRPDPPSR